MKWLIGLLGIFWAISGEAGYRTPTQLHTIGPEKETLIYVFSSPACPHCAAFHQDILPDLKKEFVDTGLAQIKMVEVPGDKRSLRVAQLARCVSDESYEAFMDSVYRNQQYWLSAWDPNDMLAGYAELAGLDKGDQEVCLTNRLADTIINQATNLTSLYHIEALPTVVVVRGSQHDLFIGADKQVISDIKKVISP